MSENKVLSSTDVWDKHMYRILCSTCTEIFMAETATTRHPDCPSVPHVEEVEEETPSVEEEVSTEEEETKEEPLFSFGED